MGNLLVGLNIVHKQVLRKEQSSPRGKGSHITIYYGVRKTVVKDRRKELPSGLLSAMAHQLGLTSGDFR